MQTYKTSIILALASATEAIKIATLDRNPAGCLAKLNETCGGLDETTGMPFPACEEGLQCLPLPAEFITLPGRGNTCQQERLLAGLGETCEGHDEVTNRPFPSCEDGLVCLRSGLMTIPGAGKTCQTLAPPTAPSLAKLNETCGGFNESTGMAYPDCEQGLKCLPRRGFITLPGRGNTCQQEQLLAGLGETCEGFDENTGRPFPSCEDGLECRESGLFSIPGAGRICTE